jgi:cobalt-zinc-cadmium efflux system membrane fusion protein
MNNKNTGLFFAGLLVVCLYTSSCKKKVVVNVQPEVFCMNDTLWKVTHLDTARIFPLVTQIKLTGKVSFDENKLVQVFPFASGIVKEVKVERGDFVEKGQVLAVVRSSEIVDFESDLAAAEANLSTAKRQKQMNEEMFKSGLLAEPDLVQSENNYKIALSEYERAKEVLQIYGSTSVKYQYTVKSPISGFVIEKNISQNMQFRSDSDNDLFTIADIQKVWVLANVYETDVNKVKIGYSAVIKSVAYPERTFVGKIDKIFHVIDSDSKVQNVRIVIDNSDFLLRPEMQASISIKYEQKDKAIAIHDDAIVFDKSRYFVLKYGGKCAVNIQEIEVLDFVDSKVYVKKGLADGDQILRGYVNPIYSGLDY